MKLYHRRLKFIKAIHLGSASETIGNYLNKHNYKLQKFEFWEERGFSNKYSAAFLSRKVSI